ncbi:hypothetical protein [Cyanobium sp. ATX 6F1]|uniref:hypothetical protein n=1 Tax=unclassified Cyanobium TaxID=2627006 RepID=UPI0020CF403E|nr:hypothetical protein [Cyanobium sp. ATX 6F1]MCP9916973.1 hypothetical protein [Cyanobium sp. ATX 6F1]
MGERRQRIHELVIALLAQQGERELLAADGGDPGAWLERNRRVVQHYQALVRSAVTLDALIDQEVSSDAENPRAPGGTRL